LKEIVVIMGRLGSLDEEMELVAVDETSCLWDEELTKYARKFAEFLRADMEKVSKKWKTYQRARARKRKSNPDFVVPAVRIAWMQPVAL
jgi:hypothetical protein